jgi:hypothetical protein
MRLATPSARRTRRSSSNPDESGRPTSTSTRSGNFVSMSRRPSRAQSATSSSKPSAVRLSARNVRVASSSSTTRIVEASSAVMPLLGEAPADSPPQGCSFPP